MINSLFGLPEEAEDKPKPTGDTHSMLCPGSDFVPTCARFDSSSDSWTSDGVGGLNGSRRATATDVGDMMHVATVRPTCNIAHQGKFQ